MSAAHQGRRWPANDPRALSHTFTLRRLPRRFTCLLFGHDASRQARASDGVAPPRHCPCGARYLGEGAPETRIRHNVSCFLFGHTYRRLCARDGHVEYACRECGHPLLFEAGRSAWASLGAFRKKVRYLCNLFGHRVHEVAERGPFTEYACHCGHTFLKRQKAGAKITHPLVCLAAGHFVSFVARRAGHAEYVCRNCGHTFCFS